MRFIGLDIETAGNEHEEYALQPYRLTEGTARVTAISVVSETGKIIESLLEPSRSQLRSLFDVLASMDKTDAVFVGWNTQFDVAWMLAHGLSEQCRKMQWADAGVYLRCIENHPNPPTKGEWGLKGTVARLMPEHAGYETEQKTREWSVVDDTLLNYNREDALYTAQLARLLWDRLSQRQRVLCSVICSAIIPVANAWLHGIPINVPNLDAWEVTIDAELEQQLAVLVAAGCDKKTLASHTKLKPWLHDHGFPVECTDRNELTKFRGAPLMDAILAYKKANTSKTKYIAGTRKSLAYCGGATSHPSYWLWNTYTGRGGYSSTQQKKFQTGIAIHQWPKRGSIAPRMVIEAPPGYLLCEADFRTQESRLLADYSGDPALLAIFRGSLDFHTYMGARVAESDYDSFAAAYKAGDKDASEFRQLGKVINLSLAYRASWRRLIDMARTQYDTVISESDARVYHALYRTTYFGVPEYWQRSIHIARMALFAETRGGRRVELDNWTRERAWATESTALNFPIQGTGADMKYLAIGIADPILAANGGRYMLDLHDALFFLVPDSADGIKLALRVQSTLSNLPYEKVYGWIPQVPMPVDLKVGQTWASLEAIK